MRRPAFAQLVPGAGSTCEGPGQAPGPPAMAALCCCHCSCFEVFVSLLQTVHWTV
jgi:hypothetical protein